MGKIEDAIRKLTPEQRALLEIRLQKKRSTEPGASNPPTARLDSLVLPISPGQARLLSIEQLTPGTTRYNLTSGLRLMGGLDQEAFLSGMQLIFQRHQVLRTAFSQEDGAWLQRLIDIPEPVLPTINLAHLPATQRMKTALEHARKESTRPIDFLQGPLVRSVLIRLAANDHIFVVTMHHMVSDNWSFNVFFNELSEVYNSIIEQREPSLPGLALQYADHAQWQLDWLNTEEAEQQRAYWESTFSASPSPLILPTSHAPTNPQHREGNRVVAALPEELTEQLKRVSIDVQLTPFALFLSVFKILLYRYSGQSDIVVCVPVAGRNQPNVEPLIGYFNNILALRSLPEEHQKFKDFAKDISGKTVSAIDHQELPFNEIARLPTLKGLELTRAFFTFQEELSHGLSLTNIEIDPIQLPVPGVDFDLALFIQQHGNDLLLEIRYNVQLFEEDLVRSLLSNFILLLENIAEDPSKTLGALPKFAMPTPHGEQLQELKDEARTPGTTESFHVAPHPSGTTETHANAPAEKPFDALSDDTLESSVGELARISNEAGEPPASNVPSNGSAQGLDQNASAAMREEERSTPSAYPTLAKKEDQEPLAAPEDDIEEILTRIWERLLGVQGIGIRDDFFELGGHSMMAVDLFAEIQKYIGNIELPLSVLTESPTISDLAQRIRNKNVDDWSPLTVIQPGRRSIPLFCIHSTGGHTLLYKHLAVQLGPDQTVYGLQSQGTDGLRPILGRVEDMARLYVKTIRETHPNGPYMLLGYCVGGSLALEIAQQLKELGEEVALVAMLETYNWSNAPKPTWLSRWFSLLQRIEFNVRNYFLLPSQERKLYYKEKRAIFGRRKAVWRGRATVKMSPKKLVPMQPKGVNNRALAEVWRTNYQASLNYKPQKFAGRVMHFLPMKEYKSHTHPGMDWTGIAREVDTHILSVYPGGMLLQPFVKELAQALRAEIFNISKKSSGRLQVVEKNQPKDPLQLPEKTASA